MRNYIKILILIYFLKNVQKRSLLQRIIFCFCYGGGKRPSSPQLAGRLQKVSRATLLRDSKGKALSYRPIYISIFITVMCYVTN